MALKFAKRMDNMKASEIRELLALTAKPDIISFAGGLPAPELFPVDQWKAAVNKVLDEKGRQALQYGPTEGYLPLREQIVHRMNKVGVKDAKPDDFLILSGSQQGLDFMAKAFIDPGDQIIVESPTYLGALNAFKAYEPSFLDVELDADGMRMDILEERLKNNDRVKFIYVISDFQNPSGKTWTMERRKKLIELANKYDVAILEDNPYGELRFEGEIQPSLKSLDTEGRVVFMGTFSKVFSPGVRLGWFCAAPDILDKFNKIKQGADLQSSTISQMELAQYLEDNDLEAHIAEIIKVYGKRKNVMVDAMTKYFPEGVTFTNPEGGLFLWVELPEYMNARDLAVKAIEQKVAYVPGGAFFGNNVRENCFRCNYSCMSEEKIEEGVKRLADVIKAEMK
ncbi:MAG: PLP-dependent aminotransferase family protein [Clostridiales bacterium]|nr:PLP-dependent aminotransferase family protein [Clostridiales bacterium]MBS5915908.1 PLP-dependent aminotransferase family protein [Clostridiales bacterium]MDU5951960.1 PLP-dependent aminotransferase family protein [Clostridiales bacterium]MDU7243932.1 PLP-dependent aminotransferase family protein [Clostridiales bacterium]